MRIDAIDANPSTLEIARRYSADYPEIDFLTGDVRRYTTSQSYDLVCCSLALHHFSEGDAVRVLQTCQELSSRFVLVADLERSLATLAGVYALTALIYREPMTRFDGRVSARRAFRMRSFAGSRKPPAGATSATPAFFSAARHSGWSGGNSPGSPRP